MRSNDVFFKLFSVFISIQKIDLTSARMWENNDSVALNAVNQDNKEAFQNVLDGQKSAKKDKIVTLKSTTSSFAL